MLKVGNYSQDFACAVLDVPVGYDQDVEAAYRALERPAWSLWDDEAWRDQVIDSPQIGASRHWPGKPSCCVSR